MKTTKRTQLDWQFQVIVYDREQYLENKSGASNIFTDWGGLEFGNSWWAAVEHAKNIATTNPEYLCVVHDRMRRKQDLII